MYSSNSSRSRNASPLTMILMIIALLALLLTIPLAASGCRQSSAPEEEDNITSPTPQQGQQQQKPQQLLAAYFPLTVGSTWSYLGEGNEYASFTRKVVFARGRRGQLEEDNGGTVIATVYEITDDAIIRVYHSGEAYEVGDLLDRIKDSESDQVVILRTPMQVGTTWQNNDHEKRTITATDAVVETPAGKFENCIVVKIEGEDSTLHEYFKEGIGMVLREFESEGYRVTSTLEECDIK